MKARLRLPKALRLLKVLGLLWQVGSLLVPSAHALDQRSRCVVDLIAPSDSSSGPKYILTNRTLAEIVSENLYANEDLDPTQLQGQRVLDVPSGPKGKLVSELNHLQVDTIGVDLLGDPIQNPRVRRGSAEKLPVESGTIDVIYSSWGFFTDIYENQHSDLFFVNVLGEFHRVLRPHGVIRIAPVGNVARVRRLLRQVPGLRINFVDQRTFKSPLHTEFKIDTLEIERTD